MLLRVADTTSMLIAEPVPELETPGTELLLNPHSDHEVLVRPVRPVLRQLPGGDRDVQFFRAPFLGFCLLRVALGTLLKARSRYFAPI